MQADPDQLHILKEILDEYYSFTGLKVNFHKSALIPINMNPDEASLLALEIGCITATLPFPYLSLPMGITKPSIKNMSPLIDRVERRLTAIASFLSYEIGWSL